MNISSLNVFNQSKAPPLSDPTKYIFQQTNQNIINIIKKK